MLTKIHGLSGIVACYQFLLNRLAQRQILGKLVYCSMLVGDPIDIYGIYLVPGCVPF